MKTKLIKLLTVAALSAGSVAAVGAIVALSDKTEVPTNLSADDTRILEVTAEDIKDAIGAGTSGSFTVDGIGFSVSGVSYSAGKVSFSEGTLRTTVASGSTTGTSGLAGAGYISAEFVDLDTNAGAWFYSKDDLGNHLGGDLIPADTVSASYSINLQAHATATFAVTNVRVEFGGPGETEFSSLKLSYKCAVPVDKHMVRFLVDGTPVNAQLIPDGGKAVAPDDPTKSPTAEIAKFVFTGWDKDPATTVITADTDFIAQFDEYVREDLVDDFESYTSDAELEDGGWFVTTYSGGDWTKETSATVTLSGNSIEANQSLRLDAYRNGMDFKMLKEFNELCPNPFTKCANTLRFTLMTPAGASACRVLLYTTINHPLAGPVELQIKHDIPLTSGEYVEYQIPYDAPDWTTNYGTPENGLRDYAAKNGINIDTLHTMISRMEIYLKYPTHASTNYCAFLDSFGFTTTDLDDVVATETLKQYNRYTGYNVNDNVVRIDINNDFSATASVIDLETPVNIPGNVTVEGNQLTFTSADAGATLTYVGQATNRGQKINFVSASGALATAVDGMVLNAVQVMDNYEQYTSDGQAYCISHPDPEERSGCRGAYYSEYYAKTGSADPGTTSPWGGKDWSLLGGDGSQLKLKNDGGHTGSKYLCMKRSGTYGMRYMQWGLFDGSSDKNAFRGTTFSFWAKTNGVVSKFTAYCYSRSNPTNSNRTEQNKSLEITNTAALGEWTHYTIELDPGRVYYGFMFFLNAGSGDTYLYIDDVEVYTADPYATYVAPIDPSLLPQYPEGTFKGYANVGGVDYPITFAIGNETNGLVAVSLGNKDAGASSISYNSDTKAFTIVANGEISAFESKTLGTITGTYDNVHDKLVDVTFAGGTLPVSNSGTLEAGKLEVWDCDGTTSELQSLFKRRYNSGSWQVDTGNADRFVSDTTNFVSGTGAMTRRGHASYAIAVNFNSDFSPAKTVSNVQFWVYNPSSADIKIRMWGYKATGLGSNFETGSVIAKAGEWTYCAMGFTSASVYNWQIAVFKDSGNDPTGAALSFDNIALF